MNKTWLLLGMILTFTLGVNVQVLATITEQETHCDLFDCYSIFETSFNIPNPNIGKTYNLEDLPDTYHKDHIGKIEGIQVYIIDRNHVKAFGEIQGATDNLWGIVLLGDHTHENSTWWNSSWGYCVDLTLNGTLIDTDLYDFTTLVKLNSGRITYDLTQDSGEDIRFVNTTCDNNGDLLKYDIIKWNESGDSFVNVKLDYILANTDRDFSMYYNNSGASDGQNKSEAYDQYTEVVFHLEDMGMIDTKNSKNGCPKGTMDATDVKVCEIGNCLTFDGAGYITSLNDNLQDTDRTLEAWVKSDQASTTQWDTIFMYSDSNLNGKYGYIFRIAMEGYGYHNQTYYALATSAGGVVGIVQGSPINYDRWVYTAVSENATTNMIYINGTLDSSGATAKENFTANMNLTFGYNNAELFTNHMDEIKISNTSRSGDWIEATYNSQRDNLLTYGGETPQPTTTTTTITGGNATGLDIRIPEDNLIDISWIIALGIFILACLGVLL